MFKNYHDYQDNFQTYHEIIRKRSVLKPSSYPGVVFLFSNVLLIRQYIKFRNVFSAKKRPRADARGRL